MNGAWACTACVESRGLEELSRGQATYDGDGWCGVGGHRGRTGVRYVPQWAAGATPIATQELHEDVRDDAMPAQGSLF